MLIFLAWQLQNDTYPHDDEGDYFYWAQQVRAESNAHGTLAALRMGYLERGFRPVLQPFVALPFLALERGAVLPAVRDAESFVYLIFVAFTLGTFSLFLSPLAAALSTIFVATLPWVLTPFLIFSSDASFLAANAAMIYFAIRSDCLRNARYAFLAGSALGIGSCFRPIEAVVQVNLAAILAFLYLCWREKTIILRDLYFALGACVAALAVLASSLLFGESFAVLAALAIAAIGPWVGARIRVSRNFLFAFLAALLIFLFWFAPASRLLFEWIYACSMGDFIKVTFPRTVSPFTFSWFIVSRWMGPTLITLLALAYPFKMRNAWLLPVVGWIIAPVVIGSFGQNGDFRRYYVQSLLALFALLLFLALNDGRRRRALRNSFVIALIGIQWLGFFQATTVPGTSQLAELFRFDYYNAKHPEGTPTNLALVDKVRAMIPAGSAQRIGVYNLPSLDPWFSQRNNPYSFSVRSQEMGQNLRFEFVNVQEATFPTQAERVKTLYQWFLVTYERPVLGPFDPFPPQVAGDEKFSRELLLRDARGDAPPHFELALRGENFRLFRIH